MILENCKCVLDRLVDEIKRKTAVPFHQRSAQLAVPPEPEKVPSEERGAFCRGRGADETGPGKPGKTLGAKDSLDRFNEISRLDLENDYRE